MVKSAMVGQRRTTVDDIFDHLYQQISTLVLKPGDRISEAEIAAQFEVSRQPVRDAFSRLATQDLLLIRPQRATEVRRFSMRNIEKSRFIRAAIEKEVLVRAAALCDDAGAGILRTQLLEQAQAAADGDFDAFGPMDYAFHKSLCGIAGADYAFDVILEEKAKVDRLCLLGHKNEQRVSDLVDDHRAIAEAVIAHDAAAAVEAVTVHLSRLDETIEWIEATNANYFDPTNT